MFRSSIRSPASGTQFTPYTRSMSYQRWGKVWVIWLLTERLAEIKCKTSRFVDGVTDFTGSSAQAKAFAYGVEK